jgi:pimeloyl-ACP methyl ester carboxylesterase
VSGSRTPQVDASLAAATPRHRQWWWWAVAAALIGLGAAVLLLSTRDVPRTVALAGSTPVRVLEPAGAPVAPAVVLSHGFSGSAAMMDPLGSALARAGHLVVMPDLPGHGTNGAPLGDDVLEPAVAEAVAFAANRSGLPVAVVGHSMGAGAVTRWATEADPAERDPVATVAISLPSAEDLPADASRPRNLLLLWGSAEPPRFVEAAAEGLRVAYPDAVPGATVGLFPEGTARRAASIAGAEHIGVIYRAQTAREVATWVTSPFAVAAGGSSSAGPEPIGDARFVGLLLVLVGGVVATRPLLARSAAPPSPRPRGLATVGWFALAAVVAGLAGMALGGVGERVPVAVAGYLMAWFGAGAVVLGVVGARRRAAPGTVRGAVLGTVAGSVVAACLALPARLTWAAFALPGQRWGVFVALLVVLGAWCWGEARLLDGERSWRRAGLLAVSRVLVVAGLLGAVVLLGAPGFLTLTVPLMVPILAVLGVVAWWARDPLAAAAAQAIPLALTVATTFPLLG